MRKLAILVVCVLSLGISIYISCLQPSNQSTSQNEKIETETVITQLQEIPTTKVNGMMYYLLEDLMRSGVIKGHIDKKKEICHVERRNHFYQMERDIPVMLHNGIYEPLSVPALFWNNTCYLSASITKKILVASEENVHVKKDWRNKSFDHAEQLTQHLSFLQSPIPGAHVSTIDSSLPGAIRAYRNGVHEGLDWYTFGTGKVINTKTPVLSMGTGVIIRADHRYQEMKPGERNRILQKGSLNNGQTPAYILDKLRGKTVWVQLANGVMARYCHLSQIPSTIKVGEKVRVGDILGYVGNSGTSDGALRNKKGLHLHLDIFVYGQWLWGRYTLSERRMILESIFNHPHEENRSRN